MSNLNNQVLSKVRQQIRNDYKQNPYATYHGGKLKKTKKNPWIEQVKTYSKNHNMPYKQALIMLSNNRGNGLLMY